MFMKLNKNKIRHFLKNKVRVTYLMIYINIIYFMERQTLIIYVFRNRNSKNKTNKIYL